MSYLDHGGVLSNWCKLVPNGGLCGFSLFNGKLGECKRLGGWSYRSYKYLSGFSKLKRSDTSLCLDDITMEVSYLNILIGFRIREFHFQLENRSPMHMSFLACFRNRKCKRKEINTDY